MIVGHYVPRNIMFLLWPRPLFVDQASAPGTIRAGDTDETTSPASSRRKFNSYPV
jgi:hypothetical protein